MSEIKRREGYTQDLVDGIRALEVSLSSDDLLIAELRAQGWIVDAIRHTAVNQAVKAAATHVHNLLGRNGAGSEVRAGVRTLIAEWARSRSEFEAGPSATASLAWWSSVSAVCSTIFAILLGTQGVIPLINEIKGAEPSGSSGGEVFAKFNQFEFTVALLHVSVIALFILFRFTQFGSPRTSSSVTDSNEFSEAHDKTVRQFLNGWTAIWITWFCLYLWFALTQAYLHFGKTMRLVSVWAPADVLNIINAIAFFYCYLTLDMPHLEKTRDPARNERFRRTLVALTVMCAVVASLSVLDKLKVFDFGGGAGTLLSFVVAISMAYFFGRLDSHYLGVRRWMLAPLYLYVAIQVTWSNFGQTASTNYQAILFCLALILKIYLYVAVTYWLQSGALSKYIERACREYPNYEIGWSLRIEKADA